MYSQLHENAIAEEILLKVMDGKNRNMKYTSDIIVVGAGAAGMVAAITAARNGATVTILEHMDMAGKKILATGNGKCNYTNSRQGVAYYYGDNPAFVLPVFEQFGHTDTLKFFRELGILPKEERGYYYPASKQAASIREVLLMELLRLKVNIQYNCGIRGIYKEGDAFRFDTKEGTYYSKACIMATGGCTAKKTGSDGSGFLYLERLGHHIIDVVPALVALQGKQSFFAEVAGIRAEIKVGLYVENELAATEEGELQLTDYGISGIPVFQVSRMATKALLQKKSAYAMLDFAPSMSSDELFRHIRCCFFRDGKTAEQALIGTFPSKLIPVFLRLAQIETKQAAGQVAEHKLHKLAECIQNVRVDITGSKKFDSAQVTAGGVDTTEICNETLESRLVSGLYFAGEMMDIDGKCGGYNLQWAWSSGYVSGYHAASKIKEFP